MNRYAMKIEIETQIRKSAWLTALPEPKKLVQHAVFAVLEDVKPAAGSAGVELAVVLADDPFIQRLNNDYRGQDCPTDVLSFAVHTKSHFSSCPVGGMPLQLGDVIVAFETVRRDAVSGRVTLSAHLSHLVVHGVLHLLGHDHDGSTAAHEMRAIECRVLNTLGIEDPYTNFSEESALRDHAVVSGREI